MGASLSVHAQTSLIVNEVMAANISMFLDPSWNYGGWIELYNPGDKQVYLGRCVVSDDKGHSTRLPANAGYIQSSGFYVIWFDHYDRLYGPKQTTFGLDTDGGTVTVTAADGTLLAIQDFPPAIARCSYARTSDGGDTWRWTDTATPNATNSTSTFADEQLPAPEVDADAQLFTGTLTAHVDVAEGATLRYTTDGTVPTTSSKQSDDGTFTVTTNTIYRFRAFKEGFLPSAVVTRSFLRCAHDYTLPILSVVADRGDIYGAEHGIFAAGSSCVNGRPGNGQTQNCNYNMDWDRPANMELIVDGEMVLNQEVDIAACGGWSRAWTPHSFKLKAQKQYGHKFLDYKLFSNKPFNRNKVIQVRNGGNDNTCRIKDAALQTIIARSGLNIDCQSYVPVSHFINGSYIGVINMREPNNKHFALANWGYDTEEVDQFEISPDSNYVQKAGTRDSFDRLMTLSAQAAQPTAYAEIQQLLDIDEYCNYMAVELFLGGTDWPQNNVKAYRPHTEGGRFRFVLFDLDFAYNTSDPFNTFAGKQTYTFATLLGGDYNGKTKREEIRVVTLFLNLLKNDDFRRHFIDAYCIVAGSVLDPTRSAAITDELANNVKAEMAFKGLSPSSTVNSMKSNMTASRRSTMYNALKNYSAMQLKNTTAVTASLSANVDGARLLVGGQFLPYAQFEGQLFPPVTITAEAPAGYTFKGWSSNSKPMRSLLARSATWKYYDKGSLDNTSWKNATFNDSNWSNGQGPFGYTSSGAGIATRLDYGNNAATKRPTYYFRTTIDLDANPSADDMFILDYTLDDGCVVYVNGKEGGRVQMNSGTPKYATYSSTYYADPADGQMTLTPSLFKKGTNVIAVEVHNCSASSSDIWWDAALSTSLGAGSSQTAFVSTDECYTLTGDETVVALTAIFEPTHAYGGFTDAPIRINEVSAAGSIYVDEHWHRGDWIELYNATSEPYDIEGLLLSNNASDPVRYLISGEGKASTVIPPHGFITVWCDKLETESQLHAPFKLSADGGDVLLTCSGEWTDVFTYPPHGGTESVGLFPDGGSQTCIMRLPSIAASNRLTTADDVYTQQWPELLAGTPALHSDDGSIEVAYYDDALYITSDGSIPITLTICTLDGAVVGVEQAEGLPQICVSTQGLSAGVYVARIHEHGGKTIAVKFRKQ